LPLLSFKKFENFKFLNYFIEIYQKTFSLDYLLEIILKFNHLGNSLEELKIIKFNQLEDFEKIYLDTNKNYENDLITRFPFIVDNTKSHLKIINNSN